MHFKLRKRNGAAQLVAKNTSFLLSIAPATAPRRTKHFDSCRLWVAKINLESQKQYGFNVLWLPSFPYFLSIAEGNVHNENQVSEKLLRLRATGNDRLML